MASLNKILLMGNLTRDPELRRIGESNAVCNFGLAVNRRFSSGGEQREETCFVDIETWSRLAETCERFLHKGSLVLVEGRLRQDRWEDKETGAARSKLLVRADTVQFLDGAAGRGSRSGEGTEPGGEGAGGYGRGNADRDFGQAARQSQRPQPVEGERADGKVQEEDDIPF